MSCLLFNNFATSHRAVLLFLSGLLCIGYVDKDGNIYGTGTIIVAKQFT